MADPIVIASRSGAVVKRIDSGAPLVSAAVAFDHLELHSAPDPTTRRLVFPFDVVCDGTQPTWSNALVIDADKATVSITATVRCFIAGALAPDLRIRGVLSPTSSGQWLQFIQLDIGGVTLPANLAIGQLADAVNQKNIELPCEFTAPLLAELGLRVKCGGPVGVTLVPAPVAAPNSQPVADPSSTKATSRPYALRFARAAALEGVDQRLTVGPVTIDLPRAAVIYFQLDGSGANPTPITLTQTGPVVPAAADARSRKPAGQGAASWVVSVAGLPPVPVLAAWNRASSVYVESLQTVADGRPNTLLPIFDLPDYPPSIRCDPPCPAPAAGPAPAKSFTPWIVTMKVTGAAPPRCPDRAAPLPDIAFRAALPLPPSNGGDPYSVWFPGIICHSVADPEQPLRARFGLMTPVDRGAWQDKKTVQSICESVWTGFVFRGLGLYPILPDGNNFSCPPQRVRIGSLDLEFGCAGMDRLEQEDWQYKNDGWEDDIVDRQSQFQLWFRAARALPATACLPITDSRLVLCVVNLTPGGQDDLPPDLVPAASAGALADRFQREPPVVVPLRAVTQKWPPSPSNPGQFTLQGTESTRGDVSQTLSLTVFERNPAATPPTQASANQQMLVVLDREPFLLARVHAPAFAGLGGADGNREVGNWLNARPDGSSWQLAGARDGFTVVFPPQGIGEGTEKRQNRGVTDGKAVDFRFSPAAQFQLLGSFYQQNFTEASWNLRRLLGYPGQQAPGAIIKSLAFELLWGLNCQVRTGGLQLAELAARIGATPGALPDALNRPFGTAGIDTLGMLDTAFQDYQDVWADQFAAYLSRLGIFELWNLAFGTLTISDKLIYALRTLPNSQPLYPDPAGTASIAPGSLLLPGGVLWGLEFESQVQEVTKQPTASGELSRPAFSALGGWGYQKAVFAKGLTTIYSDTAMGRTFYYSVEQRGRIAQFWNIAKHVVVYERTVAPSAQFAGTGTSSSDQDHLPGRPVLRKVREYVELIQPIRNYPDFNAKPVASGCVQGIEFKTRIIPVNSTWGRDVRGYKAANPASYQTEPIGYALPLWQKGADPSVYPKPHVGIRAAGASADGESFPLEIDEPEKLLFFAYTPTDVADTPDIADTDKWPAIRGVDYPDLTFPTSEPIDDLHPGADLDAPAPSEVPVHSGFEAYTYAVVGERSVNVVATRTAQAVGAVLRNLTMVRSTPTSPSGDAATAAGALDGLNASRMQLTKIVSSLPATASVDDLSKQVKQLFDVASTTARQAAATLGTTLTGVLDTSQRWADLAQGTIQRWQSGAMPFLSGLQMGGGSGLMKQLQKVQDSTDIQDPAQKVALATSLLTDRLDALRLTVPALDPGIQPLQDLLGRIAKAGDQAAGALANILTAAQTQFTQLLQGVDSAATSLSDDLQGRLHAAADDLQQQLVGAVGTVLGQARSAAASTFADLPSAIGQVAQSAIDAIAGAVGNIRDAIQKQDVQELTSVIAATADSTNGLVAQLNAAFASVAKQITTLGKDLSSQATGLLNLPLPGSTQTLGDYVDGLRDRLLGAVKDASSIVNDFSKQLQNELTAASGLTDLAPPDLKSFVDGMKGIGGLLGGINPDGLNQKLDDLGAQLDGLLGQSLPVDALRQKVGDLLSHGQGALDDLTNQLVEPLAAKFPEGLSQAADSVGSALYLARAFGDAPNVAGLGFNRDQLGYFFNPVQSILTSNLPIDISPVNALMNRAGEALKAVGARLPATQLLDQILPPSDDLLKNFNLGSLLPDFAGLKLDKLLPDLTAPAGLKDKVKITHQFDAQKGSGWVQADVNIPEDGPTTLFDAGPIRISLSNVTLSATLRIEASLGGSPQHTQSGQLAADWTLTVGGQDVITFRSTSLTFDNSGHTHFNLDPKKIEMNGVLAMLSQAVQAANSPGGASDDSGDDGTSDDSGDGSDDDTDAAPQAGLTFKLIEDHGSPVGAQILLEIPLPDVTFGVCGLANLSFGAMFELTAVPEFALAVRAHVAEKKAPFTLTLFILGGGGWFDVQARYLPFSNRITTALSIGVSAGAMLAIDFGVVKGSVYAYFYIEAELQTDSAAPGVQLQISIGLVLGGQVDVLGIVSVSLQLLLELTYSTSDHALTGRGTISLSIKICWLITIHVSASVEKRFATIGGGSSSSAAAHASAHALALTATAASDPIGAAVTTYLNTLE